jgi:hypothetical protein
MIRFPSTGLSFAAGRARIFVVVCGAVSNA